MSQYSWKNKIFSSKTVITKNRNVIGHFSMPIFKITHIELYHKRYFIKRVSLWDNTLEVYQNGIPTPIAKLLYNHWKSYLTIIVNDISYCMKYNSIFSTNFKLYLDDKVTHIFTTKSLGGYIETEEDNLLLIALGIYCHIKRRKQA